MKISDMFYLELSSILKEKNIKLNEPMKNHTTFKVGGPVDILVTPETFKQVIDLIKLCNKHKIKYYIIGNGSNLLVKDGGIRGVAIKLSNLNKISVEDNIIVAEGGASLARLSIMAMEAGLTGLEFACGIPGSVGGALTMNAGAYNGEISNVVESAIVVDIYGEIKELNKENLELGYRMSAIIKNDFTVLQVKFCLEKGEYIKIKKRVEDLNSRRREKQPLEFPSAGSTFKRPEGYFAAKLIEDCGLKGTQIGGAEVSKKHSGFIINSGSATANDILQLIMCVQKKVKEQYDVDLSTEVRVLGED